MASQRPTFGKRQREQNRKDKARAKQERLAARRAAPTDEKGPPIAWAEAVQVIDSSDDTPDESLDKTTDETSGDPVP